MLDDLSFDEVDNLISCVTVASQRGGSGFELLAAWGLSVCSSHVLPVSVGVSLQIRVL